MLPVSCSGVTSTNLFDHIRVFDTAGILGRELRKCREFAAEWLRPDALQKDPKVSVIAEAVR